MSVTGVQPVQPALGPMPVAGLTPASLEFANHLLTEWGHRLGPVNRPFGSQAWTFDLDGFAIAVAVSASTVSDHVIDETGRRWERGEVVELARLCSCPTYRWVTRPMLRLWREVAARRWPYWPVEAAVSYSHDGHSDGQLYRFDGWVPWQRRCGSSGGGTWSTGRDVTDAVLGPKTLWGWRYTA